MEPRSGGGDADDQVERAAVGGVPGLQDDRALEAARPARAEVARTARVAASGIAGGSGTVASLPRRRCGGAAPRGCAASTRLRGDRRVAGCVVALTRGGYLPPLPLPPCLPFFAFLTLNLALAGVGSVLPAASVAATSKRCLPGFSFFSFSGGAHFLTFLPSSLHSSCRRARWWRTMVAVDFYLDLSDRGLGGVVSVVGGGVTSSQASPMPSPSLSAWSGLGEVGSCRASRRRCRRHRRRSRHPRSRRRRCPSGPGWR